MGKMPSKVHVCSIPPSPVSCERAISNGQQKWLRQLPCTLSLGAKSLTFTTKVELKRSDQERCSCTPVDCVCPWCEAVGAGEVDRMAAPSPMRRSTACKQGEAMLQKALSRVSRMLCQSPFDYSHVMIS